MEPQTLYTVSVGEPITQLLVPHRHHMVVGTYLAKPNNGIECHSYRFVNRDVSRPGVNSSKEDESDLTC